MRKILWNKNTRVLKNGNKIILGNRYNGQWIKISKECYDILDMVIKRKFTDVQMIRSLEDQEDKEYFKKLLNVLYNAEFIVCDEYSGEKMDIDLAVTNRCNLYCKHCCVDSEILNRQDPLSLDEIKVIIQKLVGSNPKSICITGGEPLVRNDFKEIVQFLRSVFQGEIRLMTNGTLINKQNVEFISDSFSAIDISLDGVDETTCSKIRGKGVFAKVINTIELLHGLGFSNISMSMVLTKENYCLRDAFIALNEKLGTRAVVRAFSPMGRGENNSSVLAPGKHEKAIEEKLQWSKEDEDYHVCCCGAISKELYINHKGNIFPCGLLERDKYLLENIQNIDDFSEYIKHEYYKSSKGYYNWLALQPENHKQCRECKVNLFCWNCLHYLDLLEDNESFFMDECPEIQSHLEKVVWGEEA